MLCQQRFRSPSHASTSIAVLLLALAQPTWSDDRDLLRETSGNPYVFVLFDTSGSMNERPETSAELLAAADSPESKMYQAKEALYEVISEFDDIHYGFATFNQDDLRVYRKHWIYRPLAAPSWSATLSYPLRDEGYAFGGGAANTQYSCGSPKGVSGASDLNLSIYPRTGETGSQTYRAWLRQNSRTYFVQTRIASGSLGDATLTVELTRWRVDLNNNGNSRCGNNPPSSTTFDETVGPVQITYALVTDTLLWTQGTSPAFNDKTADDTCTGWDPNTDTSSDDYVIGSPFNVPVNVKYPTTPNALSPLLSSGDVLPLDWNRKNKDEILTRLAPNVRLGESVPDFRIARYFKDQPTGDISADKYALELRNPSARPLVAEGSTPLGNSVEAFRTWYAGCPQGSCPKNTGWKDLAATYDTGWACRKKYLIVLTDGDETCRNGNGACSATASLRAQEGVTTFVIAFGVQGGSNVLTCMAANGGSGKPVYPQDKTALLKELRKIFGNIREQSRTFASAAVPGVQAEVQDKIYLTNFTPLNNSSYWDGHVDAYLKPLPLTDAGLPDKKRRCDLFNLESGCLAWDAGEKILDLAPSAADLAMAVPDFHMGDGTGQRRVFYTQAQAGSSVPVTRRLFKWQQIASSSYATKADLWTGLGISPIPAPADASGISAATQKTLDILKSTFRVKTDAIQDPFGGPDRTVTYLLGDIFHSNPILLSTPNRLRYFADDLYTLGKRCSAGDPGYRCFAKKHERRRKMLIVGANDQQLHVFDAGIFRGDLKTGLFDDGTGYEIYSYVPRPLLPTLKKLTEDSAQQWGVDGTIQFDDVFIDPRHNGVPTPAQRQWRSVVIGGLREGGSGYFALDLTQPDTLGPDNIPQPLNGAWVPSCWDRGSDSDADCGPVPFGSVLWSFTDAADADGSGGADLGETWSTPNTGRIRIKVSTGPDVFEDKYVAIFGGGMDPAGLNQRGNWLYMVDVETGKALYKRRLDGSAPGDPAAVDANQDGYLDTVYIGTTAGYLYKADLRTPPLLEADPVTGQPKILDAAWEPFKIFDTVQTTGPAAGRRGPVFFAPSVIFVTQLGRYALAFGTGNRQDLWARDGTPGRFYVLLDEDFAPGMVPRRESDYANITATAQAPPGADYLLKPRPGSKPGWFLELDPNERIITKSFALSGILIFTSYDPRTVLVEESGDGGGNGNGNNDIPVCARSGESNIFTVYTTTGDPVGNPTGGGPGDPGDPTGPDDPPPLDLSRHRRVPDFVTNPFVESSATKNKVNPDCDPDDPSCLPPPAPICKDKEAVTLRLMALFPSNCQFASHTQNIETIQSDNGLVCIAPVPVCVVRKNWKEN